MKTYVCSTCRRELPIIEFHKDSSSKGHYSICKHCRSMDGRRILNDLLSNAKRRAAKHGLPCSITRDDIVELNTRQDGKCVYTGIALNWEVAPMGRQRVCPPDRVSLDRIDSSGGYVSGNIQLVTDFVNRIKCWYPEDDVIRFCRLVIQNHDK